MYNYEWQLIPVLKKKSDYIYLGDAFDHRGLTFCIRRN